MEGAGFVRAHSEKVVLKNNIFLEDNPSTEDLLPNEYQIRWIHRILRCIHHISD